MDRNDQGLNRSGEQESQRDAMHGSDADRGMSDRGMSGAERQGGYGDDAGAAMEGTGTEGGNRNDPRTGTTANQTGSNRPNDVERMQGRPSEITDDQEVDDAPVQRDQGSDREDLRR